MGSGAYAVPITTTFGAASARASVPLVATGGTGPIKFADAVLSLSYDDFGTGKHVQVRVQIVNQPGGPARFDQTFTLSAGRITVSHIKPDDLSAAVLVFPDGTGVVPGVTALVEYSTP